MLSLVQCRESSSSFSFCPFSLFLFCWSFIIFLIFFPSSSQLSCCCCCCCCCCCRCRCYYCLLYFISILLYLFSPPNVPTSFRSTKSVFSFPGLRTGFFFFFLFHLLVILLLRLLSLLDDYCCFLLVFLVGLVCVSRDASIRSWNLRNLSRSSD